jgi:hypothetical protein
MGDDQSRGDLTGVTRVRETTGTVAKTLTILLGRTSLQVTLLLPPTIDWRVSRTTEEAV